MRARLRWERLRYRTMTVQDFWLCTSVGVPGHVLGSDIGRLKFRTASTRTERLQSVEVRHRQPFQNSDATIHISTPLPTANASSSSEDRTRLRMYNNRMSETGGWHTLGSAVRFGGTRLTWGWTVRAWLACLGVGCPHLSRRMAHCLITRDWYFKRNGPREPALTPGRQTPSGGLLSSSAGSVCRGPSRDRQGWGSWLWGHPHPPGDALVENFSLTVF